MGRVPQTSVLQGRVVRIHAYDCVWEATTLDTRTRRLPRHEGLLSLFLPRPAMKKAKHKRAYREENHPISLEKTYTIRSREIKIKERDTIWEKTTEFTARDVEMTILQVKNYRQHYRDRRISGLYDRPRSAASSLFDRQNRRRVRRAGKGAPCRPPPPNQAGRDGGWPKNVEAACPPRATARKKSSKKAQHVNVAAAKPRQVYKWRSVFHTLILAFWKAVNPMMWGGEM